MNRKEILTKALAISKRNGFDVSDDFFTEIPAETWLQEGLDLYFSLIFDHNFAKCFFGSDLIQIEGYEENAIETSLVENENPMSSLLINRRNVMIPAWEFHLAQMVLSSDPLLYISKIITVYEQAQLN